MNSTWEEIDEGLESVRPISDEERRALLGLADDLRTALENSRTHHGDLITLEDYRRVFRRAPLGSWGDTIDGVSPRDSSVGFCRDGNGWASHEVSQMFGYSTELEWRERDEDFAVDLRRADGASTWMTFDYRFSQEGDGIVISLMQRFAEDDEEVDDEPYDPQNDPDEWTIAFFAPMSYDGPCHGRGDAIIAHMG